MIEARDQAHLYGIRNSRKDDGHRRGPCNLDGVRKVTGALSSVVGNLGFRFIEVIIRSLAVMVQLFASAASLAVLS
jgi:hypothetical protein